MAENSKIEWTMHTINPWHGCTNVHAGCDHCYAEILSRRWKRDIWGNDKPRLAIKSVWNDLERFQKLAAAAGEMHRVFVGSMMDIFEKPMPLIDSKGEPYYVDCMKTTRGDTGHLREELFMGIDAGKYENLLFLFLTKRPSNINKYIPEHWKTDPPKNVMFGTSVVNQETANTLIPQLLQVNGKKFLSCEPLIGPIEFSDVTKRLDAISQLGKKALNGIDWVIVGGESGNRKDIRPMYTDWARSIRDQCEAANIPFFFKQWGEFTSQISGDTISEPDFYMSREGIQADEATALSSGKSWTGMYRLGKSKTGALLDSKEHKQFPA